MGESKGPFPWALIVVFAGAAVAGAGIGAGIIVLGIRIYEMFTGT